jgi:hypothetical protein
MGFANNLRAGIYEYVKKSLNINELNNIVNIVLFALEVPLCQL